MRTAKVQANLRIRAVSPESMLFANVSGRPTSANNACGLAKGPGMRTDRLIQRKIQRASSSSLSSSTSSSFGVSFNNI